MRNPLSLPLRPPFRFFSHSTHLVGFPRMSRIIRSCVAERWFFPAWSGYDNFWGNRISQFVTQNRSLRPYNLRPVRHRTGASGCSSPHSSPPCISSALYERTRTIQLAFLLRFQTVPFLISVRAYPILSPCFEFLEIPESCETFGFAF